ncbi:MAG: RIP metalloprotease RseP [Anaerolineae bacterium]|jgi:regulator of sigma E protease|nr:RIP metalloprotease RseP [Anaerolineae bacterium]
MLDFLINNDLLSSLLAFAIVLIPAVIIHEFGHLLAAKMVGITVLEFGVGFPPRVVKLFSWGETDFTLNWLPLGGFVRPLGEDLIRPLSQEETERDREKLFNKLSEQSSEADRETQATSKPQEYLSERDELAAKGITNVRSINEVRPLARIFFMVAGAVANFISALILFIIVALIGIPQESGSRVGFALIEPNSPLATYGLQTGDFIETLNGVKFESSREFFRQLVTFSGKEVTVTVRREDIDDPITLTFTPTEEIALTLANAASLLPVTSIQENSPAALAGIQPEDVVVQFAGQDLTITEDAFATLQQLTREYQGQEQPIVVLRGEQTVELMITPRIDPPQGTGRLGIGLQPYYQGLDVRYVEGPPQQDYVPQPLGSAIAYGFNETREILTTIAEFPVRLLRQETQPEENRVVSVVGVSQLGGEFLQESIEENRPTLILNFIALISIALGVTNLLPIPALDGGRILFVIIEMIRGKPLPPEREGLIHLVGLAFLLSLGILVILNDIINPITNLLP